MFKKAIKQESKLRLAIAGTSGSGKTYTSLVLATHLAQGGVVAVLDTEKGSAAKYSDLFEFDTLPVGPGATMPDGSPSPFQDYHPDNFVRAIEAAVSGGYKVVVLDSLSHAWSGQGGILDLVDQFARRMKSKNSFAAWKDATPIQNRFIDAITGANIHIIATMRSKQEYVIEQVERGGRTINTPRKVGMAPIQRDGFEYEFDVFMDMDTDNTGIVSKSRCPELSGAVIPKPDKEMADTLLNWLSGAPPPAPKDWEVEAQTATSTPLWAIAAYNITKPAGTFTDTSKAELFVKHVANGHPFNPVAATLALNMYTDMVANDISKREAVASAKRVYENEIFFAEEESSEEE